MLKYNIIPKPNNYTSKDGTYVISSNTEVLCSPEFVSAGRYLTDYLRTKPVKGEGAIKFQKVAGMENEAYSISVSTDGIMIKASSSSGAFLRGCHAENHNNAGRKNRRQGSYKRTLHKR
mgnify:CR=1 FL=1